MIKKHFKNDIKKTKELLTMISKNIYETDYDGLTYKETTELIMKEKDKMMAQKDQQIEQKDQQIEQLKQEIKKLKQNSQR